MVWFLFIFLLYFVVLGEDASFINKKKKTSKKEKEKQRNT